LQAGDLSKAQGWSGHGTPRAQHATQKLASRSIKPNCGKKDVGRTLRGCKPRNTIKEGIQERKLRKETKEGSQERKLRDAIKEAWNLEVRNPKPWIGNNGFLLHGLEFGSFLETMVLPFNSTLGQGHPD
jgi:hypothetical protein